VQKVYNKSLIAQIFHRTLLGSSK